MTKKEFLKIRKEAKEDREKDYREGQEWFEEKKKQAKLEFGINAIEKIESALLKLAETEDENKVCIKLYRKEVCISSKYHIFYENLKASDITRIVSNLQDEFPDFDLKLYKHVLSPYDNREHASTHELGVSISL